MFKVSALSGFGGGGGGPVAIEGSVLGNVSSAPSTTHSLGNIDVGAASGDKKALLLITWSRPQIETISSLTIGGVALTEIVSVRNTTFEYIHAAIWGGNISAINGSQAISVTFTGTVDSAGTSGVSVSGLKSFTPASSDTYEDNASATATITALSGPANGIVVAVGGHADDTKTASWSSMTEKADVATGADSTDHRHTAAWDLGARVSGDEVITWTGSDRVAASGASFR